jgi:hypothetical protein
MAMWCIGRHLLEMVWMWWRSRSARRTIRDSVPFPCLARLGERHGRNGRRGVSRRVPACPGVSRCVQTRGLARGGSRELLSARAGLPRPTNPRLPSSLSPIPPVPYWQPRTRSPPSARSPARARFLLLLQAVFSVRCPCTGDEAVDQEDCGRQHGCG